MNTAFVAVADDPSAIVHNPAGITQLHGKQFYGGASVVIPTSKYQGPDGQQLDTRFKAYFPPHLFVTTPLGDGRMTAGLGVYAPFGIGGRQWPADGLTRYSAIESFIATVSLNPTLAIRLDPKLSVAAGFDYMRALNFSDNAIDQRALGAPDARLEIDVDGSGWGYNLALLYRVQDSWTIAAAYRSGIEIDQRGDLQLKHIAPPLQPAFGGESFQTAVRSTLDFPGIVSLGMAWRLGNGFILDLDAEWVGWSSFKKIGLDLKTAVPAAGLDDRSVPLKWRDAWVFKLGADYQLKRQLSIRAGYAYLQTPVPKTTLTPGNPDANQHNISFGLGWRKQGWTTDFYYNIGLFEKRRVENSILPGRYQSLVHYLGISLGYQL